MGLMALLAVTAIIFNIAQKTGDSNHIAKELFADEIRLAINTVVMAAGDAQIQLPQNQQYNITDFSITLWDGFVIVSEIDKPRKPSVRRWYHLPKGYTASGTIEGKKEMYLIKDGSSLRLVDKSTIPDMVESTESIDSTDIKVDDKLEDVVENSSEQEIDEGQELQESQDNQEMIEAKEKEHETKRGSQSSVQ